MANLTYFAVLLGLVFCAEAYTVGNKGGRYTGGVQTLPAVLPSYGVKPLPKPVLHHAVAVKPAVLPSYGVKPLPKPILHHAVALKPAVKPIHLAVAAKPLIGVVNSGRNDYLRPIARPSGTYTRPIARPSIHSSGFKKPIARPSGSYTRPLARPTYTRPLARPTYIRPRPRPYKGSGY